MVRDIRIKTYRFAAGSLAAPATGNFSEYTERPLNGKLYAIQVQANNYTATGSMFLFVSGTMEKVWGMTSGTITSNVAGSDAYFPRAFCRFSENNTLLSGTTAHTEMDLIPLNSVLNLVGSGLGNTKSGTGFNIVYI